MFNDMFVPITGSNLQVKVKPQQTKEFDVSDTSVMGYALTAIGEQLNEGNGGGEVTPTEPLQVTISFEDESFVVDKTYQEIKKYGNNLIITWIFPNDENEGEVVEYPGITEQDLPKGHSTYFADSLCYYSTGIIKNPDNINFYLDLADPEAQQKQAEYYMVSLSAENICFPSFFKADYSKNYYYVSWDGSKYVLNDLEVVDGNSSYVVGFDKSVTSHIESILKGYGYTKQSVDYRDFKAGTLFEYNNQAAMFLNKYTTPLGKYKILGTGDYASELDTTDIQGNYYVDFGGDSDSHGYIAATYKIIEEDSGVTASNGRLAQFTFKFTVNDGVLELLEEPFTTDCDKINDMPQTYDIVVDNVNIDVTAGVGTGGTGDSPSFTAGNIALINNCSVTVPEGYVADTFMPRYMFGIVLDEAFDIIPVGSIVYQFEGLYGYGEENDESIYQYGMITMIYAEPGSTEWKTMIYTM